MTDWAERASAWGIDAEYVDAQGIRRRADDGALAVLVDVVSQGAAAPPARRLPATVVMRQGAPASVMLACPAAAADWIIVADGGQVAAGVASEVLTLPSDLPVGSYRLDLLIRGANGRALESATLLVAPRQAFQPTAGDVQLYGWALAVQLYALRSRRNWGHGDFTDLAVLLRLAGDLGAAGIALNPLHALFDDDAERASPYSPNSRLFLNPLYIDVDAVPEFPGRAACGLEAEVERLQATAIVDYGAVARAKIAALRAAYAAFPAAASEERRQDLASFREESGAALARFASFEVLRRRYRRPWWEWPERWRAPDDAALARLRQAAATEIGFYEFVQWQAERQLAACHAEASRRRLPLGLYADVAVGVDPAGADAWTHQTVMLREVSVGAPPDALNRAGQVWGLTTFNPHALEQHEFRPLRQTLAAAMRHAGAIRLDHVLGLSRLFLVPRGFGADAGAYLRCPFEAMLAVVAQESVRRRCLVIGEDLGTVPEDLRRALADWGIWSYLVMLFERGPEGAFRPPETYAENALVTFTTHDLPTFSGWWSSHDLSTAAEIGLIAGETEQLREHARQALRQAVAARGLAHQDSISFLDVARFLGATPSRLLVVALEDVLGMTEQPNVPGTVHEHPNWRHRPPVCLEDLTRDARLTALAALFAVCGRNTRNRGG
jgi:4-alpha-glucanotransferase